jgi:hypothetical protein
MTDETNRKADKAMLQAAFILFSLMVTITAIDLVALALGWKHVPPKPRQVNVSGRMGNVVSIPWIGNGYNLRMQVNVPSLDGKREWMNVWSWQAESAQP